MFGSLFGYFNMREQQAAAARSIEMACRAQLQQQQADAERFRDDSGARMVIIKPDGTMIPIFEDA